MHYFKLKGKYLYCEDVQVEDLAKRFGTPLYVYSQRTLREHFDKIKKAFKAVSPLICYSVKANSNISILKSLVSRGAGLDIVSAGELYRAMRAGCSPKKIVYASVGKTAEEIKQAIKLGILMFNVESLSELAQINAIAGNLGKKVDVALRINPDINPKTHKYITTGRKETKFGIEIGSARKVFLKRDNYPNLNIVGVHIHIGSQIIQVGPFIKAIKKILKLFKELNKKNIKITYFNIGGGLGIIYDREKPQTAQEFSGKALPFLKEKGLKIILEPGRFIVGNAGILVTKVLYIKENPSKRFIVVDAAMNDLIRPALYGAYHKIVPAKKVTRSQGYKVTRKADVVGPVCESGDFLGKDRKLDVAEGDFLAVMGAGAYSFSMSSNYNSRPKAAEVLVKKNRAYLIRKREDCRDLVGKEILL
ncbi:MAG: diaminopimelate decarboxylase [Candidatus Omnitrophica bacterium]|nr:diaminopimelate decarboxylase [Candidatus Omnitrophota bacterium]